MVSPWPNRTGVTGLGDVVDERQARHTDLSSKLGADGDLRSESGAAPSRALRVDYAAYFFPEEAFAGSGTPEPAPSPFPYPYPCPYPYERYPR